MMKATVILVRTTFKSWSIKANHCHRYKVVLFLPLTSEWEKQSLYQKIKHLIVVIVVVVLIVFFSPATLLE